MRDRVVVARRPVKVGFRDCLSVDLVAETTGPCNGARLKYSNYSPSHEFSRRFPSRSAGGASQVSRGGPRVGRTN